MPKSRFRLFRLFGFEVGIDPSWILLAVLVAWSLSTGYFPFRCGDLAARQYWVMGSVGALGLFLSIVIHGLSHSLVARRRGVALKDLLDFLSLKVELEES